MMMHKKLQKVLAVALMTSFFSTSFIMGVSEAAAARHAGGQRPAQTQQIRPVPKSTGHQARPASHQGTHRQQGRPMQRSNSGHHGQAMQRNNPGHQGPAVHRSIPKQQGSGMHRSTPQHKAQPVMHKSGSAHHGPAVHKAPQHKAQPTMHRDGAIHHRGPVAVQKHHPMPPAPPRHHHDDHRSMHSGDWIGALLVGGLIGAIIANNSHKANNVEYVYAD